MLNQRKIFFENSLIQIAIFEKQKHHASFCQRCSIQYNLIFETTKWKIKNRDDWSFLTMFYIVERKMLNFRKKWYIRQIEFKIEKICYFKLTFIFTISLNVNCHVFESKLTMRNCSLRKINVEHAWLNVKFSFFCWIVSNLYDISIFTLS